MKPGRKIFLYINAVHPKEVVIDDDNNPREDALKSFSFRQGMARLEELGFKNIRVVKVLGDNDCIVKVTANGKVVKKTEKVPVTARLVVEVYDGRLGELRDSLQLEEYRRYAEEEALSEESQKFEDYSEPDAVHLLMIIRKIPNLKMNLYLCNDRQQPLYRRGGMSFGRFF